ncbi:MAG: pyridoxal-phosphate dependent enzyme, partial [Planctomycetota bacterium]
MDWQNFWPQVDFAAAAERLRGVVLRTELRVLPSPWPWVEVLGKLENRQRCNAFKARGAWNHLSQWDGAQKAAGVVAASSGNHGLALAWAANELGIRCVLCMPEATYRSKVEACRALGADVRLFPTRLEAEAACDALADAGATRVHGYDAERTMEGAGTVGFEIADELDSAD